MPRKPRCVLPGVAYHITQRGTNGHPVFYTDADRKSYLRLLAKTREDAGVRLLAWCLMTNHVHLIAVPEAEDSLEILLRRVHGRYAQMVNARRDRTGHLWQNRFFSCALDSRHLRRALAYVERNPVRAGMVERPEDHPWSSARVHVGLESDRQGLLDLDFWRDFGGEEAWRDLLLSPEEAAVLRLLRRCTYSGRPFGSEEFLAGFETRFGRRWRRWKFEKDLLEESRLTASPA
jgi:putative transposase